MPKRGAVALLLTTGALALLLSFKTPGDPAVAAGATTDDGTTATTTTPTATAEPEASTLPEVTAAPEATTEPAAGDAVGASLQDGTVTGDVAWTRWGAVQVQVTIAGGVITDVAALQLPDGDRHSSQLSSRAEPLLRSSALAAQSAEVDLVSGATYTSLAYAQSLQAALDAARA